MRIATPSLAIWLCLCTVVSAQTVPGQRLEDSLHRATGVARFVRIEPGTLGLVGADRAARAADYFARYGTAIGIRDAARQLVSDGEQEDRYGYTHLRYRQVHRGVPVFAGTLRAHFDPAGRLHVLNGTFVPGIQLDPTPAISSGAAEEIAVTDVLRRIKRDDSSRPGATSHRLVVFRTGLLAGQPGGSDHLVWEIEVGNGEDVREFVFVDAHDATIVERITGIHDIITRKIHEGSFNDVVLWNEGDSLPYDTGNPTNDDQVNSLIETAEDVYDFFGNLSGGSYLSWDGADDTMHSVWLTNSLPCPNASWNGTSTNYCEGVASDDIVAHEWSHGYTEATHGLIYQWQPGALNEAYSDIFGELIDQLDGAGTDAPSPSRSSGDCSLFGGNPPPALEITAPAPIAGEYAVSGAAFNPAGPLSATGPIQLVDDGSGDPNDGCEAPAGFTAGNIALVRRGNCNFGTKVSNAEAAGASATIVINTSDNTFNMGGNGSVTIPAVMVGLADGLAIEAELGSGVSGSVTLDVSTANSLRWLMGEDSAGFGGAIRDMWNPSCFNDPDRVSDPRYWCGTSDSGGVHSNSGVPNHTFALLVDGGGFNGQLVAPIGAIKAAHLYWRAMTIYQVEDSGFADHADALAQSCSDLIGVDLNDPMTGASSGQAFTAFDCSAVSVAIQATELYDDPPCDFAPLLAPGAPAGSCGTAVFHDDLELDPSASWTFANEGVFAEYSPRDWVWTSSVPEGGQGSALFALDDINLGNCIEGDDDQSGRMTADTPPILLADESTVLFDHYVATEPRFDGGNLRISVNGGPFALIDSAQFTFNGYNDLLAPIEEENTNPLASQPAFTGSDGGVAGGSWGQSQLTLAGLATAGDTVRLRFDFGVDGCNGLIGWYVDNVTVCSTTATAGRVDALWLSRDAGGDVGLSWGASCHVGDGDYELYEGVLGDFVSHTPRACSTGGATELSVTPAVTSSYYLVVPANAGIEGSYGSDSQGSERPPSTAACSAQSINEPCDP